MSPPGEPLSSVWLLPGACLLSRLEGTMQGAVRLQGEGYRSRYRVVLGDGLGEMTFCPLHSSLEAPRLIAQR